MKSDTDKARDGARRQERVGVAALAATTLTALALTLPSVAIAAGGPPVINKSKVTTVALSQASVQATLNPNLNETTYSFQYITEAGYQKDGKAFGEGTKETPQGKIKEADGLSEPHLVSATIEGLAPGVLYRTRLFASNKKGKEGGETLLFGTYPEAPASLPDSRAYEQASPLDKDGGDAIGLVPFVKAALDGNAITFASSSGIPGGVGAQELPTYLASREGEGSVADWQTRGLLPPQELADKARVVGWTPGFSSVFQQAIIFGEARAGALYERSASGAESSLTGGYLPKAAYAYAGSSADEGTAIFEATSGALDENKSGAEKGRSNVYAWDGSRFHLASVLPGGSPAAQGAFAGPYGWAQGRTNEGGAASQYYTQEERAVAKDGSVFFTTSGDAHLYERRNPTAQEDCASATKACTLDVSPSRRSPADPAGKRPRAFAGASTDGDTAFFTSSEKLTNDANTGPEVEGPKIGRATIGAPPEEEAEDLKEVLADHHAVGIATAGEYIYWADPVERTIGRAKLDGSEVTDPYVEPGETCAETHPETEPGQKQCAPAIPRYVAVGPCAGGGECIYWTNTGPLGGDLNKKQRELPAPGAGTIGRAKLGAAEGEEVKAAFIAGASNPQGIAVNASHIYWANSLHIEGAVKVDIARAALDGSSVEQGFHELGNSFAPYGVALSATRVYWTMETASAPIESYAASLLLEGGSENQRFVGKHLEPRGITLIGPHLYWAAQGAEEIGRVDLELKEESLEAKFLKVKGALGGLATEASHLYWSANGDVPPHPGNDLYRFQAEGTGGCSEAGGCLTDLTADSAVPNGAEVKGVVAIAEDGTRVYFVANAALAGSGAGAAGDCGGFGAFGSGKCNLYVWEASGGPAGTVGFIARLDAGGERGISDQGDWLPTMASNSVNEQKNTQLSGDGHTFLFRSHEEGLTPYKNEGRPELYLYRTGRGITCVSCDPRGLAPIGKPSLGSIQPSALRASYSSATASRNLSEDGGRVFFETPDALSPRDTNGESGCPPVGAALQQFLACLDVYEWEAPGEGGCKEAGLAYSPLDEGCLYLISSGKSDWASLMGDASASGNDVFFFSREGLVGQDKDELLDVYDARVGGGISAQNPTPLPPPCESAEACRGPVPPPPAEGTAGSAEFSGPPDPKPKHAKAKKHGKAHRHHGKGKRRPVHAKRRALR